MFNRKQKSVAETQKSKTLFERLRPNKHTTTERFAGLLLALAVSFGLVITGATAATIQNNREAVAEVAVYTQAFSSSRTGTAGTVENVFVSPDRTRVLVMMKFDKPEDVSLNADDYQGFLTGSNPKGDPQTLKTPAVVGEIISFGSTGYLGVMLESPEPFQRQVLSLTMRANAELVVASDLQNSGLSGTTFAEFDQWRVFVNPGAEKAAVSPSLEGEEYDLPGVFNALVIEDRETEVRDSLDAQLAQLQVDLVRIDQAERNLAQVNVEGLTLSVSGVPSILTGDKVTGTKEAGDLVFVPKEIVSGGHSFDWRSGSVLEGYLDDLAGDEGNYLSYLQASQAAGKSNPNLATALIYSFSDGTLIGDHRRNDPGMEAFFNASNQLTQEYQTYFTNKDTYQRDLLTQLLRLELDLRMSSGVDSINNSADALVTY